MVEQGLADAAYLLQVEGGVALPQRTEALASAEATPGHGTEQTALGIAFSLSSKNGLKRVNRKGWAWRAGYPAGANPSRTN